MGRSGANLGPAFIFPIQLVAECSLSRECTLSQSSSLQMRYPRVADNWGSTSFPGLPWAVYPPDKAIRGHESEALFSSIPVTHSLRDYLSVLLHERNEVKIKAFKQV